MRKIIFRSRSVPRPPFTLFTPPSSNESNKRGEFRSPVGDGLVDFIHLTVPMNKIVLKPKPSKPDLKNIRPKVNTLENTHHKVTKMTFLNLQTA